MKEYNKNIILTIIGLVIMVLMFIALFVISSSGSDKQLKNINTKVVYNITAEQKAQFLCPIKCIDNGFDGGEYFKLAKNCYCYNKEKKQ